ncbi:DeoR/GlpR family DNA-binding transcription regulator [Neobacillus niacini]|uniref:DeoR/GlpR family DNA-binding transcription regulator n=1 Tax=Neobacillus niacini TaxID=86668 RepID=UPI0021CB8CFA|nr:DeoR/GlpR family DNA-binding transcription regulator [Neobacillus niacini]MCM3768120.1 DeoR/GlpR family DNA-binding transcription regulator [Neobacillus niacini]
MLIEERLEKEMKIIEENKTVTIESLAEFLSVSKDTIRRDLIKLEKKNVIRRIHGGAVLASKEALIFNYSERANQGNSIKEKIAEKTAKLVKDHSSVIFDSSTTVEAVIPKLNGKNLKGITNSLTHAILLAKNERTSVSVFPGKLNNEQLFLYGAETVDKIRQYHVDYTLLGVFAISENGLFIHTEEEGLVKRAMVQRGNKIIALADHTKIGTTGYFKVCSLDEIDILVTDKMPELKFVELLAQNNVDLVITDE